MAIYADGVPMTTDRLLGLMALAIGGALAWFLFEPVMSTTAAHDGGRHYIIEEQPAGHARKGDDKDA